MLRGQGAALETERQIETASDVLQLPGVCAQMDDSAFLALRSEELTSDWGARLCQFGQLVDKVTNVAVVQGWADIRGLKAASGSGWDRRYMKIHGHGCYVCFDANDGSRFRSTPLWLRVKDKEWQLSPSLKKSPSRLELEEPPRLLVHEDELHIPFYLPLGKEKGQVVESLIIPSKEIATFLSAHM